MARAEAIAYLGLHKLESYEREGSRIGEGRVWLDGQATRAVGFARTRYPVLGDDDPGKAW